MIRRGRHTGRGDGSGLGAVIVALVVIGFAALAAYVALVAR